MRFVVSGVLLQVPKLIPDIRFENPRSYNAANIFLQLQVIDFVQDLTWKSGTRLDRFLTRFRQLLAVFRLFDFETPKFHPTESVDKIVLQKSNFPQNSQLIVYFYEFKYQVDAFVEELTF